MEIQTLTRTLSLLAASSLLLVSGVVHGLWTDRWVLSSALEDAVARLEGAPLSVGEWRGNSRELPSEEEVKGALLSGCRAYRFVNRRNQQAVNVLLMCGRPGPLSVHTPDICYTSSGYKMTTGPEPLTLEVAERERVNLKTATFRKEGAITSNETRIFWTWNGNGRWQAPENPRWSFARAKALYKLYILRERGPKDSARPEEDPAVAFLKIYLPELNRALFPAPSEGQ